MGDRDRYIDDDIEDLDGDIDWIIDPRERAIEHQRRVAARIEYARQVRYPVRLEAHELLRHVRHALGLGLYDATGGPLRGILTPRRLRRVERGEEDIPPRAWRAYAELAADRVDLSEAIARQLARARRTTSGGGSGSGDRSALAAAAPDG
jgi:hypothetical protein